MIVLILAYSSMIYVMNTYGDHNTFRDVNRKPEIRFSVLKPKPGLFLWQPVFEFIFLSFSSRKLHKNYQISDKINSHICLMLSVYKSFIIKRSNMAAKEPIYYKI